MSGVHLGQMDQIVFLIVRHTSLWRQAMHVLDCRCLALVCNLRVVIRIYRHLQCPECSDQLEWIVFADNIFDCSRI